MTHLCVDFILFYTFYTVGTYIKIQITKNFKNEMKVDIKGFLEKIKK